MESSGRRSWRRTRSFRGEINDFQRAAWQKSIEVFDVALLPPCLKLTLPPLPPPAH